MTSSKISSTCSRQQVHLEQAAAYLLACELPTFHVLSLALRFTARLLGAACLPCACKEDCLAHKTAVLHKHRAARVSIVLFPGLEARPCILAMHTVIEASRHGQTPPELGLVVNKEPLAERGHSSSVWHKQPMQEALPTTNLRGRLHKAPAQCQ